MGAVFAGFTPLMLPVTAGGSVRPLAFDVVAPTDTSENILATITCPALSINGIIRLWQSWTYTNNANNKTLRTRLGGGAGSVIYGPTRTTQLSQTALVYITANGATNSQHVSGVAQNGILSGDGVTDADFTVDLSAPFTIVLSAQKVTAGDTVTLQHVFAELLNP